MINFFDNLFFSRQYIPHGHCYLWQPQLLWLHVLSDAFIALAYYSIPLLLIYFIRQREDVPFKGIFILFSLFILSCGTTHAMSIWTLWNPDYWLSGLIKAITAIISIYTALALIPTLPQALALRSPIELAVANQKLQQEIIKRSEIEQQLAHDALHDALTGLPNRTLLKERIELTIQHAKRNRDYLFALLFIDLDRFKTVNDSRGHLIGDQLLITVAKFLLQSLRDNDLVARLGGDEFVILLDGIHKVQDATQIAARILDRLAVPFDIEEQAIFISASIGIVVSSTNYDNGEDILRDADIAMYRAKEKGKACYEVFDRAMYLETLKSVELENNLRHALQRGELILHYQPIISLSSQELVGFEALIRWRHPQRGLILPSEFIAIAEDTGLIVPIGEWVLAEACQQLKVWQQKLASLPPKENLKISINIASEQFKQPQFIQKLDRVLLATGLNGSCLRLEITESVLVESGGTIQNILAQIKKRKIKLSIDDFGTGYSSLSYLKRFPIDNLKIDRSFIEGLNYDEESFEIVRTIITLAKTLGMETISEGIETAEQLTELKNLGCEFGQGYLLGEPLDVQEIELMLVDISADYT